MKVSIEGIKQATNQQGKQDREIVKKAVESHAKEVGKQLIARQGQETQKQAQTKDLETELEEPETEA